LHTPYSSEVRQRWPQRRVIKGAPSARRAWRPQAVNIENGRGQWEGKSGQVDPP